jgi:hypothetical protein
MELLGVVCVLVFVVLLCPLRCDLLLDVRGGRGLGVLVYLFLCGVMLAGCFTLILFDVCLVWMLMWYQ